MNSGEHELWNAHMQVAPARAAINARRARAAKLAAAVTQAFAPLAVAFRRAAIALGDKFRHPDL